MIIPADDKKDHAQPAQDAGEPQPVPTQTLRQELETADQIQLSNMNPPRSNTLDAPPPQYEEVASTPTSPAPGSSTMTPRSEKDTHRFSIQSQASEFSSSADSDINSSMARAALEASPAYQPDGRFQVSIDTKTPTLPKDYATEVSEPALDSTGFRNAPPMNVNIMIVGSRGDVQPYLALGQRLVDHGHTVRITTHEMFRQSVKDAGLRFFNIGGDPHQLMSYMVRNPGLMPGFESLTNDDIPRKQMMVAEMLERCWRSCYEPDELSDGGKSFAADAIISNPPTFAHIHCAEALGIPLLMSFTMPWTPTTAFPHPLVNVQNTSAEPSMTNFLTYGLADMMTWQGLGHTINKFRRKRLALPALSVISGAGMLERCSVPWTYCLSPALVPKPEDWMKHIDVAGFYFMDLARGYVPPPELEEFLNAGEPPIYIGFGSIVVKDKEEMTRTILSAVAQTKLRAVISSGWGSLDADLMKDPKILASCGNPDIFVLDNVPHDWLFDKVCAVVHHGGAGTTAAGLRCGKPTVVIPFFGDQMWWGSQVHARNAGPAPVPSKPLSCEKLVEAIQFALREDVKRDAGKVGELIWAEDGVGNGMDSFHRHLPLMNMRCDLDSNRVAAWYSRSLNLKLSAFAAQVLAENGVIDVNKLELHRTFPASLLLKVLVLTRFKVREIGDVTLGVGQLMTTHPEKGVMKLVKAVPEGLRGTMEGLHQGLKNSPKIYGSTVREPGKISGFRSGMKEGGKEFVYGFYDGFADLVREPIRGFKRAGVGGAIGGLVTGTMNVAVKPSAGVIGLFSRPMEGTAASARNLMVKPAKERHVTRYAEGLAAFKASSEAEKQWVLNAFEAKKGKWKGKKKAIAQEE
ncbi:glycosyltransferase family 1 protein [Ceratobasidium sp. AG-Ba]|nr:glycosyltransferase family 1 protein [Ceratobasidium sp. AG-Ba]